MLDHIDHVAIAVWDIDQSLPYYLQQLHLSLVHDETLPDIGVRLAYLDAGNTYIQLVQPTTSPSIQQFLTERGEGLHHICFSVQDIPTVLEHLQGEAQTQLFKGGRQRYCTFLLAHPNSTTIELTEQEPYLLP